MSPALQEADPTWAVRAGPAPRGRGQTPVALQQAEQGPPGLWEARGSSRGRTQCSFLLSSALGSALTPGPDAAQPGLAPFPRLTSVLASIPQGWGWGGDATQGLGLGQTWGLQAAPGARPGVPLPPSSVGGAGQPHLSLGKLSLGKACDRARFPLSFRCTRPPNPARGSALSWLSVRSLDSRRDQLPVSGEAGAGCAVDTARCPGGGNTDAGQRRRGGKGTHLGPPTCGAAGGVRGAPPSPAPGSTAAGPTRVPSEPRPLPEGVPLLCWPLPPAPCTLRPQGPEPGTGQSDWPHRRSATGSVPRSAWEPEARMPTAPPEKR